MKTLAPSLATLAVLSLAPALPGLDVEDKDLKLSIILNLQTRAEVSNANNAAGSDYDIVTNTNGKQDAADFYIRRFRPGIKGTYQEEWKFAAVLNGDFADREGTNARAVTVHQAFIGREFQSGDITHYVQGGLDYAWFNMANASNSAALLPNQRASQALMPVRGTGVGYRVGAPIVRWGFDVQNNTGDAATSNGTESEGLCYTTRLELTGPGNLALKKWQETYLNQPGTGFIVGIDLGVNQKDRNAAGNSSATTTVAGVDVVFHWEGLNALAEFRHAKVKTDPDVGASTDLKRRVLDAQVGYAVPVGPVILEPAVRYSRIDLNTDVDETGAFSSAYATESDFGSSGKQVDVGLNCYFNGHGNKLELAYTHWKAESGDADANIIRLQHQLNF